MKRKLRSLELNRKTTSKTSSKHKGLASSETSATISKGGVAGSCTLRLMVLADSRETNRSKRILKLEDCLITEG
jgi:hypothetical protein